MAMDDAVRVVLSLVWFASLGGVIAGGLLLLVTWGDYLPLFAWSLGGLIISTSGHVITSLQ